MNDMPVPDGESDVYARLSALADARRIEILDRLSEGSAATVTELAAQFQMTRQGVTRHVKTLEQAGILSGQRGHGDGRETRYVIDVDAIDELGRWLSGRAASWDRALGRLARFVESD